jgi:hypothetical protein
VIAGALSSDKPQPHPPPTYIINNPKTSPQLIQRYMNFPVKTTSLIINKLFMCRCRTTSRYSRLCAGKSNSHINRRQFDLCLRITLLEFWPGYQSSRFRMFVDFLKRRDSTIGIATDYGLVGQGTRVRIPVRARFISSPRHSDRFWGTPSLLCNGYRGFFPRE